MPKVCTALLLCLCNRPSDLLPGQTNSSDVLSVGGVTSLGASISFNPKTGKLETHSLQTTLEVGECRAELNSLLSFLEVLKEFKQQRPPTLSYPRSPTNPFFVPSPLSSPRTSLWTPMLSPLNTASLSPLTSAPVMSPIAMSPTSSSSPFFDAISVCIVTLRKLSSFD